MGRNPVAEIPCAMCRRVFLQSRSNQKYCSPHCKARRTGFGLKAKTSAAERGYGAEHQKARAAALAQLDRDGIGTCCIGGEPIYPGQALHLDHTPDRSAYRGLACAHHNRVDGARRGRQAQLGGGTSRVRSRDWIWGTRAKAEPRALKPKKVKAKPVREPLTCPVCTVSFVPTSGRKTCSGSCSLEWNARQNREAYRARVGLPSTWDVPTRPSRRVA